MANLKKIPVKVASNLNKETIFLNANGDQIDKIRGSVIKRREEEPTPPAEVLAPEQAEASGNPLETIIKKKVEEAVMNSISNIDIGKMVEDAVSKAFGGGK